METRTTLRTWQGERKELDPSELAALRATVSGAIYLPSDPGYEEVRRVWNGTIDRFPAFIVSCRSAEDVQRAVSFARRHEAVLAVRGGGHSFAGHSTCDGGIVVDLSSMKKLRIDPERRLAFAEPGLRWADFDAGTQRHGLAVTGGQVSHTGIAGLTLGGGMGWLARERGLTIDHLLAADVVTADGEQRRAAPDADVDLSWAIRGGGGNFGVVTAFTYGCMLLDPTVTVYQAAYPLEAAAEVLPTAESLHARSPRTLTATFVLLSTPEGHRVATLNLVSTAPDELAANEIEPFRRVGLPIFTETVRAPYTALQQVIDQVVPPGFRYYGRANFLDHLDPAIVASLAEAYRNAPSPRSLILFILLGGAVAEVPEDATAFAHRTRPWALEVVATWQDPADDGLNRAWMDQVWAGLVPQLPHAVYVNALADEGEQRLYAAYGRNYERLAQLKRRYDPSNLFRLNQNISPA